MNERAKQNRKTDHSYRALEYVLKAARELEDPYLALQLREAAREGDKLSVDLDHTVVEILLSAGRLEDARACLEVIVFFGGPVIVPF